MVQVTVAIELYDQLTQHAQACLPREACGLLGATGELEAGVRIARFVPTRNIAREVDRFAIDPLAIARTSTELRAVGLRLWGTFHSHPGSPARPSMSDHAGCGAGLIHLILSLKGQQPGDLLTAWRHFDGKLSQLPLRICTD